MGEARRARVHERGVKYTLMFLVVEVGEFGRTATAASVGAQPLDVELLRFSESEPLRCYACSSRGFDLVAVG